MGTLSMRPIISQANHESKYLNPWCFLGTESLLELMPINLYY